MGQATAHARDDSVGALGQSGNRRREFEYILGLSPTLLASCRLVVTVTVGARKRATSLTARASFPPEFNHPSSYLPRTSCWQPHVSDSSRCMIVLLHFARQGRSLSHSGADLVILDGAFRFGFVCSPSLLHCKLRHVPPHNPTKRGSFAGTAGPRRRVEKWGPGGCKRGRVGKFTTKTPKLRAPAACQDGACAER